MTILFISAACVSTGMVFWAMSRQIAELRERLIQNEAATHRALGAIKDAKDRELEICREIDRLTSNVTIGRVVGQVLQRPRS